MKKYARNAVYSLFLLCLYVSCRNNGNISLTLSESDNYYKIIAAYPVQNTANVERYMSQKLGKESNVSFVNTRIDAEITLNDGTKFYMKNAPGNMELKLDKTKNTYASYQKIKTFGEGLKPVLHTQ